MRIGPIAFIATLAASAPLGAQQRDDPGFDASVTHPAFAAGTGPVIAVDAGHHNFHTINGRYRIFGRVAVADGFQLREVSSTFTAASLQDVAILVIANAATDSVSSWQLPTHSAFTPDEIDAVERWVREGGALLLIADHMPAAGAAADLARRFGGHFTNGYTLQPDRRYPRGDLFTRADGTLQDHPVSRGGSPSERVDSVVTFTGQAFQVDPGLEVILRFGPKAFTYLPVRAGVGFDSTTPRLHTGGWAHLAVGRVGRGRVALVGEAAMFSAQLAGQQALPMGMNYPPARENKQLLLNLLHWLAGRLAS